MQRSCSISPRPGRSVLPHDEIAHFTFFATTNHAFGPPSLKVKSFRSCRTSALVASMDSMLQPWAKAACSSFFDTRLGPCSPGSSSLKHIMNSRPPGFRTVASPST